MVIKMTLIHISNLIFNVDPQSAFVSVVNVIQISNLPL